MFMSAPAHILTCDCSRSHALKGQSSRPHVGNKPTTWLGRVGAPWLTVYQHEWVNSLECTEWGWGNFLERKWGAISTNGEQKNQQMSTSPPPYANIFDFNSRLLKTDWLPWKGRKGSFALIIKKRAPSHKTSQHWKVTRCLYVHFLLGNYYSPVSQMRKGGRGRKKRCRRSSAKQESCSVPRNSVSRFHLLTPGVSLSDLPLLTREFMGASGELLTATGTFSQRTQPPGVCSYSTDLLGGLLWGEGSVGNGGGEGTPGENFQRWKYFPENTASVCRRCRYNWPSVLSWSWEWIFYRKKEMHGCGAASSKGSFQATCHGAVYRHKSQKGWSGAVERVWFVGCGAWHLAPGHADLTQSARATPLHTVVSGRLKWKEQKEKALIRGAIKTEPEKEQK